jgi:chemotaxis protein MotB
VSKKKKHDDHEEHVDESWLIPYADLLTLLLALFIILFASSKMDSKKYDSLMKSLNSAFAGGTGAFQTSNMVPINQDANFTKKQDDHSSTSQADNKGTSQLNKDMQKEEAELEDLKQHVDKFIKDNNLSGQLETKLDNEKLMITISDRALFDSGSAVVKADSQTLAVSMSEMLSQYAAYHVEVAGHTDNVPIHRPEFETNWDLSAKRALNFMKIVLNNPKINPAMYSSIGYGEYRPVGPNDTTEGRAKNRRVEVSIIRKYKTADNPE